MSPTDNTNLVTKQLKIYPDPSKNTDCSEFEVDNWVISEFIVNELLPIVGWHPYPLSELSLMVSAATYFKPSVIFEWGTHIGKAARIFYEASEHFNLQNKIYSIDLPADVEHNEHPHEQRGMLVKEFPSVNLLLGDGLDTALETYTKLGNPNKPLFYLDGDHSYDSVKRELEGILKQVTNPIIIVHDTFYQSEDSKYNVGPYQAIKDVLSSQQRKYKMNSSQTGLPGMTLIYFI